MFSQEEGFPWQCLDLLVGGSESEQAKPAPGYLLIGCVDKQTFSGWNNVMSLTSVLPLPCSQNHQAQ